MVDNLNLRKNCGKPLFQPRAECSMLSISAIEKFGACAAGLQSRHRIYGKSKLHRSSEENSGIQIPSPCPGGMCSAFTLDCTMTLETSCAL
ncbi:hypothetical protein CCHOA_08940 [Corynebacterium choanae]|uniref:Uncharacterized protein n=1 Tax=Corynebacterium choanae TaxID=1862358 RepID=A0A3G6J7S7_9CORY|nr:hypothetical protein CCHOA_08940 [Corynebacterium choanae]